MLPGGLAPVSPGGIAGRQIFQVLPDGGPFGRGDAEPRRVTGALVHGQAVGAQDTLERPPIRWIASRDRWFRTSVCRHTERTPHTSKAWVSISRFISVFAPVRSASRASQV